MWKIEITTLRQSIATFKQNEPLNKQAYIVDGKMDRLICKHGSTHIGQTNWNDIQTYIGAKTDLHSGVYMYINKSTLKDWRIGT